MARARLKRIEKIIDFETQEMQTQRQELQEKQLAVNNLEARLAGIEKSMKNLPYSDSPSSVLEHRMAHQQWLQRLELAAKRTRNELNEAQSEVDESLAKVLQQNTRIKGFEIQKEKLTIELKNADEQRQCLLADESFLNRRGTK